MTNTVKETKKEAAKFEELSQNPFVKPGVINKPEPQNVEVIDTGSPIPSHVKLWEDAKALIKFSKSLGVDVEVLLRGVAQEVDKQTVKQG